MNDLGNIDWGLKVSSILELLVIELGCR
uniref:Uncharacterized protein n=1 Tax=Lepeophtheirus salmonis TaxID=72036 RepID=A0A0K2TC18_LEPSM